MPLQAFFNLYRQKRKLYGGHLQNKLHTENKVCKGKVKVKFTLQQAMKAQRGRRGMALLFF
jgi:hypothetical protein